MAVQMTSTVDTLLKNPTRNIFTSVYSHIKEIYLYMSILSLFHLIQNPLVN